MRYIRLFSLFLFVILVFQSEIEAQFIDNEQYSKNEILESSTVLQEAVKISNNDLLELFQNSNTIYRSAETNRIFVENLNFGNNGTLECDTEAFDLMFVFPLPTFLDLAWHPSGQLYGIDSQDKLWLIVPNENPNEDWFISEVSSLTGVVEGEQLTGLVINNDGLFIAGGNANNRTGHLYTFTLESINNGFGISNRGMLAEPCIGDLVYHKGILYMTGIRKDDLSGFEERNILYKIDIDNLDNNVELGRILNGNIEVNSIIGLCSFPISENCNENILIASNNGNLYRINTGNLGTSRICGLTPATSTGLTIVNEHLNSIECECEFEAGISIKDDLEGLNCEIESLELIAEVNGFDVPEDFDVRWSTWDGNIITSVEASEITIDRVGTYNLELEDPIRECVVEASILIEEDIVVPELIISAPDVLGCNQNSITITTELGAPLDGSIQWSGPGIVTGVNSLLLEVNQGGFYQATLTNNANGCIGVYEVEVIENRDIPAFQFQESQVLTCSDGELILDVVLVPQINDFTVEWNTDNGNILNGQNSLTLQINAAGMYEFIVTNNLNECSAQGQIEVTEDVLRPQAVANVLGMLTCINTSVILNSEGSSSGNNISYNWTQESIGFIGESESIEVNTTGIYTLVVTNTDTGCSAETIVEVLEDKEAPIANAGESFTLKCDNSNAILNGISSSIGNNFLYNWHTSDGTLVENQNSLSPTISAPGTYTLEVTDTNNGCVSVAEVLVNAPDEVNGLVEITNALKCFGDDDGSLTAIISTGTMPFDFNWNNGSLTQNNDSLFAGTYSITITDSNACTQSLSIQLEEPEDLNLMAETIQISSPGLNDGSIEIEVSGGTLPYDFLWSNGSTSPTIDNLPAGLYTLTVTDANDCEINQTFELFDPAILSASIETFDVECFRDSTGTAEVSVQSGNPPFNYMWSNGMSSSSVDNLKAGNYFVTIIDDNGQEIVLAFEITEPNRILTTAVSTQVTCYGYSDGTAEITANGGVPPYEYKWGDNIFGSTLEGLAAGSFRVTTTDDNGCIALHDVVVETPDPFVYLDTLVTISCFGESDGALGVQAAGGTPDYIITWSNGIEGEFIESLEAGQYSFTLVDASNCTDTVRYTLNEPDLLLITEPMITNASAGDNDGSIVITVEGGTLPYSYLWSTGSTSQNLENVEGGSYSLTVSDANGCQTERESIQIEISTSVSIIEEQLNIDIFPNPTQGRFNVSFENITDLDLKRLDIYTSQGENVSTHQIHDLIKSKEIMPINLDNTGVYFLRFSGTDGIFTKKIVVVN